MAKNWQVVETNVGVNYLLAIITTCLHLEKNGRKSANVETVVLGAGVICF